jgi:membrane-bound serine protease (ClpP class)
LLGIILAFLEAKIPGFGLAGVLSTLCFALVFYGRYLLGAAEWLEGILFLLGLALVAVELFVVPGTLYAGIMGGILMALSLFLSFQTFLIPRDAIDAGVLVHNLVWGSGIFLTAVVCMLAISRFLPKSPLMGRLALAPPTGVEGSAAGASAERGSVGRLGVAASDLRPAGIVELDGRRVDALTEGSYISRGTAVRVIEVDGNRVVVVAASNETPA